MTDLSTVIAGVTFPNGLMECLGSIMCHAGRTEALGASECRGYCHQIHDLKPGRETLSPGILVLPAGRLT
ncbi:MAG: hypothetical protein R3B74_04970 [Nitrospirales bacterium]|nr:hypothetical protein [Nitrospirales bacterium]